MFRDAPYKTNNPRIASEGYSGSEARVMISVESHLTPALQHWQDATSRRGYLPRKFHRRKEACGVSLTPKRTRLKPPAVIGAQVRTKRPRDSIARVSWGALAANERPFCRLNCRQFPPATDA